MPKRYNLPPLAFFQGFEAAARTLSFTKAAEELFITQSAVSRQIKALEDHLGIRLFERRPRSLALTESGHALHRISADVLERLQAATDQLRAAHRTRQLSITTTTGFASLWLIPRLQRFTGLHPDIDVRISATTDTLNLERSLIDLAIRYCAPEAAPDGAVRLFGEEMIPVCAPALLRERARAPLEQADAEVVFERLDLPAHGRLGDEQLLGRLGEAERAGGRLEALEERERGQVVALWHSYGSCIA